MTHEPSGEYYDYTQTMQPERPWLLPYHQSLVYLIMAATRDGSGKMDKLYLTFEQTLDVVRKVHNLTCGIPQIVYLIGWHHEGHDSKYPDWSEVNPHLKRPGDKTALDSLRWLIRECRSYNCTMSLHLNMFDAYQDSPLWDLYVQKDIIAKDTEGKVIPGKAWGGMTSYQISYTQEWKTGLAQKRIDGLLEMIPELVEGKTIHIDAFLGARPLDREAPISPYLGYTKAEEVATQRKIYRYFRDRGIDVTSEWVNGFRGDRFVGLQPWSWHGGQAIADLPDSLYCSNVMTEAREFWGQPEDPRHAAYPEQFFLRVLPWYYTNHPAGGGDHGGMIDGSDICMPALWCEQPTLVAYSKDGYDRKAWKLPQNLQEAGAMNVSRLSFAEPEPIGQIPISSGMITLHLRPGESLRLTPATSTGAPR